MKPVSFILSQLEAAMSILNARHILLLKKCFQEGINRNKKKKVPSLPKHKLSKNVYIKYPFSNSLCHKVANRNCLIIIMNDTVQHIKQIKFIN